MNDDISVIIRCRNEEAHIGYAIQSCLDFFQSPEIIVVNNNCTDNTEYVVNLFSHDTDLPADSSYTSINVIPISNYSPGKALNLGIKAAKRKYVLVLSSHCVIRNFPPSVFDLLDSYQAVFGNQRPVYYGKKIRKRYLWSHFSESTDSVNLFSKAEDRYFLHNAFCVYQRDYISAFPFNECLVGKEDRYWANDLVFRGGKFLYKHDLIAEHAYTPNGNTWKGVG